MIELIKEYKGSGNFTFGKQISLDFEFLISLDFNNNSTIKINKTLNSEEDFLFYQKFNLLESNNRNLEWSFYGCLLDCSNVFCKEMYSISYEENIFEGIISFSLILIFKDKLVIHFNNEINENDKKYNHYLLTNLLFDSENGYITEDVVIGDYLVSFDDLYNKDLKLKNTIDKKILTITTEMVVEDKNKNQDNELFDLAWSICWLCTFAQKNFISPLYTGIKFGDTYKELHYNNSRTSDFKIPDPTISFRRQDVKNFEEEELSNDEIEKYKNSITNIDYSNFSLLNKNTKKTFVKSINSLLGVNSSSCIYDFKEYLECTYNNYIRYKESLKLNILFEYSFLSNTDVTEISFMLLCVAFECFASNGKDYLEKMSRKFEIESIQVNFQKIKNFLKKKNINTINDELIMDISNEISYKQPTLKNKLKLIFNFFKINYQEDDLKFVEVRNNLIHSGTSIKSEDKEKYNKNLTNAKKILFLLEFLLICTEEIEFFKNKSSLLLLILFNRNLSIIEPLYTKLKRLKDFYDQCLLTILGYEGKYRLLRSKDYKREVLKIKHYDLSIW